MKCPHCGEHFTAETEHQALGHDKDGNWYVETTVCANEECQRLIVYLRQKRLASAVHGHEAIDNKRLVRPRHSRPVPLTSEIPQHLADDYHQACAVLGDSPKASAALSRRCLQLVLEDRAGVTPGNISQEIDQVLNSGHLPTNLAKAIDAIRNVGNFAAHPMKSKSTNQIVDVEPEEAEWNLDVLELLFDFYYVQPERTRKKKEALDQKLTDLGKPPTK